MSSSERSSLFELAVANLRRLFPQSAIVRELLKPKPTPTPLAKAAIENVRCREKACPFPVYDYERGLCRGHVIDQVSERSVLPSALAAAIMPMHQPQAHAR